MNQNLEFLGKCKYKESNLLLLRVTYNFANSILSLTRSYRRLRVRAHLSFYRRLRNIEDTHSFVSYLTLKTLLLFAPEVY